MFRKLIDFLFSSKENPKYKLFFEALCKAVRENIQIEFCNQCLLVNLRIKYPTIFYNYTLKLWITVKTLIFSLETIQDLGM